MFKFEEYTLIVYETSKDYHHEMPKRRFVAYLKEIPEASLHEYGATQEQAIANLKEQFQLFISEAKAKGIAVPVPERRDDEQYSGKIMLRMPSWLHRTIDQLADEEGSSTNSYIVNRLIRTVTIEETVAKLQKEQQSLFKQLDYEIRMKHSEPTVARNRSGALKLYVTEPRTEYEYKEVG